MQSTNDIPRRDTQPDVAEDFATVVRDRAAKSDVAEALATVVRDRAAMQSLHRIAEQYGRLPRDSPIAEQLVGDVIGDMLSEEVTCGPAQKIQTQLERVVRTRANRLRRGRNARRRLRRVALPPELISLDQAPPSAFALDPQDGDGEDEDVPDRAEWVAQIRARACADAAALQLLELYDREITSRRDVLRVSGMTKGTYRAARERLTRYGQEARDQLAGCGQEICDACEAVSLTEPARHADEA